MRAEATEINSSHPRLLLDEISYDLPGSEALKALNEIKAEHPEDRALLSGRKVLACMLIPDLEQAREHFTDIESESKTETPMAKMLSANLAVQEGRVSVMNGTPMDARALRRASEDAMALRARMIAERRWSEAARLLMLAADAVALLGEGKEASDVLSRAQDEETRAEDSAIVLGESAIGRALNPELALRLTEHADHAHPNIRLIRAKALHRTGTPPERREALRTIEDIVALDLRIADEAALYRLACSSGGDRADWHEPSYQRLICDGYVRPAVDMRVYYLAERHAAHEDADRLLQPYLDEMWAKVTRVRLALMWRRNSVLKEAASDLLAAGPNQRYRFEAGQALARADELPRAKEVLMSVARDPSAPEPVRADAYALLVRIVGERMTDWRLAKKLHAEWTTMRPADRRASAIAPTIYSR